jgi:hypothetical protein
MDQHKTVEKKIHYAGISSTQQIKQTLAPDKIGKYL